MEGVCWVEKETEGERPNSPRWRTTCTISALSLTTVLALRMTSQILYKAGGWRIGVTYAREPYPLEFMLQKMRIVPAK